MKLLRSNWLRHSLTDYDNATYDTGRVLAFGYFITAVVLEAWSVMWQGNSFNVQDYLLGGGTFLTGLGFYLFGDGKGKKESGVTNDSSTNNPSIPKE